jgi:N-acetylmuramoyl-L-alanine amidase
MRFPAASGLTAWGQRLAVGAAMLGLVCVAASHGAESAAAPLKLRFGGDPSQTRVVLELDQAASAEVISDGAADGHVVLSFSKLKLGDGLDGQGKGMVKAWTLEKAAGKARLSLDLARHGKIRRRFLLPPSDGVTVYRYVMDIEADGAPALQKGPATVQAAPQPAKLKTLKTSTTQVLPDPLSIDPEAPVAAAGLQKVSLPVMLPTSTSISTSVPTSISRKSDSKLTARTVASKTALLLKKTIVIDAGHGGHDPGALGGKSHEKDVTLAAAKVLKTRLERSGRFKVVMTRDSDVYIPLESRVKIARTANADLFISLHADSGGDPKVRGATVYTLSDHGVDRATRSVFGGGFIDVQLPGKDMSVKQIILDLTQRTTRNRSGAFAETLLEHISTKTPLLRRSHRDAGYMVLLAPDVPAVLLEMGFITSPEDEGQLTDPDRREALMDSVGDAIEGYFADNVKVAAQ